MCDYFNSNNEVKSDIFPQFIKMQANIKLLYGEFKLLLVRCFTCIKAKVLDLGANRKMMYIIAIFYKFIKSFHPHSL